MIKQLSELIEKQIKFNFEESRQERHTYNYKESCHVLVDEQRQKIHIHMT